MMFQLKHSNIINIGNNNTERNWWAKITQGENIPLYSMNILVYRNFSDGKLIMKNDKTLHLAFTIMCTPLYRPPLHG